MGLLTDPIADIDEARKGLRVALRALEAALGDPDFSKWGPAADATELVERACEALAGYPTYGIDDV